MKNDINIKNTGYRSTVLIINKRKFLRQKVLIGEKEKNLKINKFMMLKET